MKRILVLLMTVMVMSCSLCVHAEEVTPVAEEEQYTIPTEPLGYRKVKPREDIPDEIWSAALIWGMEYDVCPELICAISYYESRWTNVVSANGLYWGTMQVHPPSHKSRIERLEVTDLLDSSQCIRVATDLLAELFEKYDDPVIVLMKYHGESDAAVKRYLEKGKITSYPKKVLALSAELEEVNNDGIGSVSDQSGDQPEACGNG